MGNVMVIGLWQNTGSRIPKGAGQQIACVTSIADCI